MFRAGVLAQRDLDYPLRLGVLQGSHARRADYCVLCAIASLPQSLGHNPQTTDAPGVDRARHSQCPRNCTTCDLEM
jgi:hypothetical protein